MSLTTADIQRIRRLRNELARTHGIEQAIDVLFHESRSLFPYESAVFFPFDRELATVAEAGHLTRNMGEVDKIAADYAAHYHRLDPLNVLEQPRQLNRALRTTDILGLPRLRKSEFYQEFQRPLGIEAVLGVCAARNDKPVCGIAFHREKGSKAFSEVERERLTLVAPSIAHRLYALRLQQLTRQRLDAGVDAAVWMIESGIERTHRNAKAEGLAMHESPAFPGKFRDGLPVAVHNLAYRMRSSLAANAGIPPAPISKSISCRVGRHWHSFTITVLPGAESGGVNATTVITASRRSPHYEIEERLVDMGLSDRERNVTRLLVRGLTNKEIAGCLDIKEQTVKDHLRSIFAKSGINSRTKLIAQLIWGE